MSVPPGVTWADVVAMHEAMTPDEIAAMLPPTPHDELLGAYPELADVEVEDVAVVGEVLVPARRYRSAAATSKGALVWVHGGGFIAGDLDADEAHWVALSVARRGFAVLSLDYRKCLHGQHFPMPSDDVLASWHWAMAHADDLGTSPDRIHLGGASAGANLVAGVTKRLRDSRGAMPRTLVLVYPLVHAELPPLDDEVRAVVAGDPSELRPDVVRDIARQFAGSDDALRDPYAFAANGDVGGQPPVYVLNAEIDTLRASGEAYAAQLADAGVEVVVNMEPAARHGHLSEPFGGPAVRSIDRIVGWLERNDGESNHR